MGNCKSIDDDVSQLIGMTITEANTFVENNDLYYTNNKITWVRVVRIDGIGQSMTKDIRCERINVYVENSRISQIDGCY